MTTKGKRLPSFKINRVLILSAGLVIVMGSIILIHSLAPKKTSGLKVTFSNSSSLGVTTAKKATPTKAAVATPAPQITTPSPSQSATGVAAGSSASSDIPVVTPLTPAELQASFCDKVESTDQQTYESEKAQDFNNGMAIINNILNLIGQGETDLEPQVNQDVNTYNQELQQLYNQDVALETAPPNSDGYGGCPNTLSPPTLIPIYPEYPN